MPIVPGSDLVTLADAKAHLNITNTTHDTELQGLITAMTPIVEAITGPILSAAYTEQYDGGGPLIVVQHRPILSITAVVEYYGATSYTLTQVATPDLASTYSYTYEAATGTLVRRTTGGAAIGFAAGAANVIVSYTAGHAVIPPNIRLGALELIRINYSQTQQGGRRRGTSTADAAPKGEAPAIFVTDRVREMLMPNRRFPSLA